KAEKRKILKNILLISFAFLLNFTAFQGLSRLQSSLHKVDGMGVINSAVLYAFLMLSCMFVPKLLTTRIGFKWTIPLSFSGYILWMAANGYAHWYTMVPASIIVGICAAPLWTAQCSYFTKMGGRYAELNQEDEQAVITRFFGYFFMFFQMSSIVGSIISSTILKPEEIDDTIEEPIPDPDEIAARCGANDCPWHNHTDNPNLREPSDETVWTMVGIYIAGACIAVLMVCIFVDRVPKYMREDSPATLKDVGELASATFKHLRHNNQLLLIPITMYSGFEQAFYNAEWTNSFITCSVGIWNVGLITLPFGIVNAFVSFTSGYLVKYIGRLPMFALGVLVDAGIQVALLIYAPNGTQEIPLYVLSGLWGLTDGIWQTQLNALYGSIFATESEAAFSNYRMWESLGFIIAFAYSNFICTQVKIIVLLVMLLLGNALYLVVEIKNRK
ncbi:hypothetical protein CAPTEDRAFT_23401, partial [Capitella teleta]